MTQGNEDEALKYRNTKEVKETTINKAAAAETTYILNNYNTV